MSKKIRYHINPVIGVPTICREVNNCPYGGESGNENHFDTYSDAQEYSREVFKKTYRLFPSNAEEDTNEIWREIEARKRVKKDIINELPKEDDFEIAKAIMHTDNEDVVMGVIEGEIYGNRGWKYTSVALQNPYISKKFLNEALYEYPKEFDMTTRRWLVLNRSLSHEDLVSIIENEDEDMTMRAVSFRNPNISKEYVTDIINNEIEKLDKLPYSMIVHSHNKNEKTEEWKDDNFFFGTRGFTDIPAAELMAIDFVPYEIKYRAEIKNEKISR